MKVCLIPAHLLLIVARLAYAALFLWAAFSKILDSDQFSLEVARYQIIGPRASGVVGAMLPWTEFVIGACLLIGVCTAGAWLGTVCLFAVFAVARASVLHRGLSIDCGCGVMDGAITVRSLVLSISLFLAALAAYIAEVLKHGEARPIANRRLRSAASAIPPCEGNAKHSSLAVIGAVVVAALCMPRATWGQANVSPATRLRLQACRSLQPAFDRIVGEHDRDVDIIAFTRRLAAMEDVAEAISQQIRLRQSSLLDQSLATVGGAAPMPQLKIVCSTLPKLFRDLNPPSQRPFFSKIFQRTTARHCGNISEPSAAP